MYNEGFKDKWAQLLVVFHVLFFVMLIRLVLFESRKTGVYTCLCGCECALFKHFN